MPVSCPTPNVQHTGRRSRGHWRQEVLLMLMGVGAWVEGLSQSAMHKAWAHGGKLGDIHLLRILWLCGEGRQYLEGKSNLKSSKGEVKDGGQLLT